jgi:hypothetical protein
MKMSQPIKIKTQKHKRPLCDFLWALSESQAINSINYAVKRMVKKSVGWFKIIIRDYQKKTKIEMKVQNIALFTRKQPKLPHNV